MLRQSTILIFATLVCPRPQHTARTAGIARLFDGQEIEYFSHLDPRPNFIKVAAGDCHSVALDDKGVVWVWGRNDSYQLGKDGGEDMSSGRLSLPVYRYPQPLTLLTNEHVRVVDIACGPEHTLMMSSTGVIYFCGARISDIPRAINLLPNYEGAAMKDIPTAISAGGLMFCCAAQTKGGKLFTWGEVAPFFARQPQMVNASIFSDEPIVGITCTDDTAYVIT
eukprot:Selendium_serpulae@DN6014_c1_g1_i1.p1